MRLVPKYQENYGNECSAHLYIPATPEQEELSRKALQPNQDNIIAERSKVFAKLHNDTVFGYTAIDTKKYTSSDDFLSLDPEI